VNVVCVGDCGVDHYLPSGDMYPGGITANFARQARRSFPDTDRITVVSATGNDPAAASIARHALDQQAGIDCFIEEHRGDTPVQFIQIAADGEKNFVRYDEGILKSFRVNQQQAELIAAADLLVTPVFQQNRQMFDSVLAVPVAGQVAVDFADFAKHPEFDHLEACLEHIDIAFFGLTPEQNEYIEHIARIAQARKKLMIVTLGAAGSIAFAGGDKHRCPAVPVAVVRDTTGAGDAFAAGFLASYMHQGTLNRALDSAAALAAKTIQYVGAVPDK
jgi:sugar/nucleoside kinase (ribokinase family)